MLLNFTPGQIKYRLRTKTLSGEKHCTFIKKDLDSFFPNFLIFSILNYVPIPERDKFDSSSSSSSPIAPTSESVNEINVNNKYQATLVSSQKFVYSKNTTFLGHRDRLNFNKRAID